MTFLSTDFTDYTDPAFLKDTLRTGFAVGSTP